jgi:heme-degrading monooxygenase HmoA
MAIASVHPGLGPAFKDRVAHHRLLETARAAKGSVAYELLENVFNPDEFRFVETWSSMEALQHWTGGFPQKLFGKDGDEYLMNMLVGGKLQMTHWSNKDHASALPSAYKQAVLAAKPSKGGVQATFKKSCESMWSVIGNWEDCSWVIGCKQAVLDKEDPKLRYLTMGGGFELAVRLLDMKEHGLAYQITKPAAYQGYTGNLTLRSDAPDCHLVYHFQVAAESALTVEGVFADFHKNRIPGVRKRFSA